MIGGGVVGVSADQWSQREERWADVQITCHEGSACD